VVDRDVWRDCGHGVSALTITPARIPGADDFSLAVMALGAYMDSDSTNLTRPADLYVSQFLLGFGGAMFVGPTLSPALAR
jgi:hypothetical protein